MNDSLQFYIEKKEIYLEIVLIEFQIPLLFICRDNEGERYSVLCIDSDLENLKYILIKSNIIDIIELLNQNITLEKFFRKGENNTYWEVSASEDPYNDKVEKKDLNIISDEKLPDRGIYFDIESDEICDYILELGKIYIERLCQTNRLSRLEEIIPIIKTISKKANGITRLSRNFKYYNFLMAESQTKILNSSRDNIKRSLQRISVQAEGKKYLEDKNDKYKSSTKVKKEVMKK